MLEHDILTWAQYLQEKSNRNTQDSRKILEYVKFLGIKPSVPVTKAQKQPHKPCGEEILWGASS